MRQMQFLEKNFGAFDNFNLADCSFCIFLCFSAPSAENGVGPEEVAESPDSVDPCQPGPGPRDGASREPSALELLVETRPLPENRRRADSGCQEGFVILSSLKP
jgi:hypothetical protein